jgi:hypothetical protein
MHRVVLSSMFAILMATAASAADPADNGAPAPPVATAPAVATPAASVENDSDTILCKWTTIAGSRLTQRLCLSKRRWAQMHKDSQEFMRNLEERGSAQEGG